MKRHSILFLLAAFLLPLFFACSSDDEVNESLIGKWERVKSPPEDWDEDFMNFSADSSYISTVVRDGKREVRQGVFRTEMTTRTGEITEYFLCLKPSDKGGYPYIYSYKISDGGRKLTLDLIDPLPFFPVVIVYKRVN
ncbi:hypothetical protein [Hoylesella enoeca]|uniref:Lipocalin-like domain-containing protein n=1 Tax=Hoylesella enoeca TaxID=76123 RepID=A0A0S2KM37_9BACT|nr:hypothetical protein [Hoylesella enoeca]ALO49355.1 hypothetical protein AS203_09850 [Hoylesella enoeca]